MFFVQPTELSLPLRLRVMGGIMGYGERKSGSFIRGARVGCDGMGWNEPWSVCGVDCIKFTHPSWELIAL
jgi:hypothetical protein